MSIETAERLKRELTDKYVVVTRGVPELQRFVGYTGRVKTVNMNARALVQFDNPVDISWYDIAPAYLHVVEAPAPKAAAAHAKKADAEPKAKPEASKPAAAPAAKKLSPLELARQQGAGGGAKPAAAEAAPAAAPSAAAPAKKLSPLELARQQGAAKAAATESATAPTAKPAAPAATAPAGKKLSPLELARQQGAPGSGGAKAAAAPSAPVAAAAPATPAPAPPAAEPAPAPVANSPVSTTGPDGKPLSKIELARRQGAFKG